MMMFVWEIVQTVLPFAIQKFNRNKQIKQLEIEVKKLRKRSVWLFCFGILGGFLLGLSLSYIW